MLWNSAPYYGPITDSDVSPTKANGELTTHKMCLFTIEAGLLQHYFAAITALTTLLISELTKLSNLATKLQWATEVPKVSRFSRVLHLKLPMSSVKSRAKWRKPLPNITYM